MTMLSAEARVATRQAEDAASEAAYLSSTAATHFLSAVNLDRSLMLQIQAYDVQALALLYDRHAPRLYTLALHCTGNARAAEKIVIAVFQSIWHSADSFVASTNVASWLIDLTRQHAISLRKGLAGQHKSSEARFELFSLTEQALQLGRHDAMKISLALQGLPVAQRMSIELAYYEGLSHAEIASKLNHSLRTVQRNVRQGLTSLRDKLLGK